MNIYLLSVRLTNDIFSGSARWFWRFCKWGCFWRSLCIAIWDRYSVNIEQAKMVEMKIIENILFVGCNTWNSFTLVIQVVCMMNSPGIFGVKYNFKVSTNNLNWVQWTIGPLDAQVCSRNYQIFALKKVAAIVTTTPSIS